MRCFHHDTPITTACRSLTLLHTRNEYSTACACAVVGNSKVICCNAGDSRAIIVKRDGTFIPLSYDHKPGRNDETKRINDLGGRVIYWGRWRVEGVLAVSRSIGDAKLKPFVTASPDVIEHDIGMCALAFPLQDLQLFLHVYVCALQEKMTCSWSLRVMEFGILCLVIWLPNLCS